MNKKVFENFIYQTVYQLTLIALPIITIPIVSHSLGAEGIGLYNYVTSIVTYFILFAGLGLSNYGVREIASVQGNKKDLSKKFWELEFFNLMIVSIIIIFYLIFLSLVPNKIFFMVSGISLFATFFDISWFYQGIQDFKQITLINLFVKIISFLCIIFFINNSEDLLNYFLIQSGSILLSNICLWIFIKNKVSFIKVTFKECVAHFVPALHYFIGKISITLYTTLNKTLLGLLSTTLVVGLYTNSLQLITIIVTLIGTLDMVLMPHMTKLITENNENKMIRIMEQTIDLQLFFSIPLSFGLVLINEKLIPWFFGDSFSYLKYTVPVFSPLIIIMPLGISIVRQYLLPLKKIKQFNISVINAAAIGIILNILLIPKIGIWGAVIATSISELFVTGFRLYDLKKNTDFQFKLKNIIIYFISGISMFILTNIITNNMEANFKTTIIQCIVGFSVYMILTLLTKTNVIVNFLLMKKGKNDFR
ncbi:oligosaccharide flippase family protein [Vagococcus fluvialis]|uniref:oligosaccharide flippase family protein n=1 Tax=Vagococcus fluvialis TaxID=2738 RepID=UPI0037926C4A